MPDRGSFSEDQVYTLPAGTIPDGLTADGHAFALVPQPDGRVCHLWDGGLGEPFAGLVTMRDGTTVFWSDDGRHMAYVGERSSEFFVGRDGTEEGPFDVISGSVPPTFASDGARLVYGAVTEGVARLFVDGEPISEQPIAPIAVALSADGSAMAYVELSKADDVNAEQRVVVDGVPGPWFRGMRNARGVMQFSPDGRRFAYYEIDAKGQGRWVVDGVPHQWTSDVRPLGLAQLRGIGVLDPPMLASFSPDGRRFAYAADVEGKGVAIVEEDQAGPLVKSCGSPVFSPDSRRLAYTVETLMKRRSIVVDGLIGYEGPGSPGDPVFSPDGRHVAAGLEREEGGFLRKRRTFGVVLDGEVIGEGAGTDGSGRPVFSPDGARLAWWVRDTNGRAQMYVGSQAVSDVEALSDPWFSSSGALVYAAAGTDGQSVMFDGRLGPRSGGLLTPAGGIPLPLRESPSPFRLSDDGQHVAWAGTFDDPGGLDAEMGHGSGPWARPVLDDRIGPAFDAIHTWSFDEHGTAIWWAQRGDTVIRVSATTA